MARDLKFKHSKRDIGIRKRALAYRSRGYEYDYTFTRIIFRNETASIFKGRVSVRRDGEKLYLIPNEGVAISPTSSYTKQAVITHGIDDCLGDYTLMHDKYGYFVRLTEEQE